MIPFHQKTIGGTLGIIILALIFMIHKNNTVSWFTDDLPDPDTISRWSEHELDYNLFRLSRWEGFLGKAQFRKFVVSPLLPLGLNRYSNFTFLEVGVGVGAFARQVLKLFPKSSGHGIDIVPRALEIAKRILPPQKMNVSLQDMQSLSFAPNSFDYVLVPGALCYLHSIKQVNRAVDSMVRIMRKGMCVSMLASSTSDTGSCNVRIPKDYWTFKKIEMKFSKVIIQEMDDWHLPHALGRYSICILK